MITEIITTGTELLLGEIDNENSRYLAELMNEHGFTVAFMTTVGDNPERMRAAFATALSRADLVITSGGLGSTQGDITKKIGAEVLGLPYVLFPEEVARLAAYYKEKGRPYLPSLSRQAWFAEGAELLRNEAGSASGCFLSHHGKLLVHLPGPPFEMKRMAEKHMLPSLQKRLGEMGTIRSMILPIPGRTEAEIEETIMDLIRAQGNPTIALLARPGYIALRVTAKAETAEAAYALMSPLVTELRKRLPIADYHIGLRQRAVLPGRGLAAVLGVQPAKELLPLAVYGLDGREVLLAQRGKAAFHALDGVFLLAQILRLYLLAPLLRPGDYLRRADVGLVHNLPVYLLRRQHSLADLRLLAVQPGKLRPHLLVLLQQCLRLRLNIGKHSVDLVGVIILLLDEVDLYPVKILLVESHSAPPCSSKMAQGAARPPALCIL